MLTFSDAGAHAELPTGWALEMAFMSTPGEDPR